MHSNHFMRFLFQMMIVFISFQSNAQCLLPSPQELKSNSITSCQFKAKWKPVSGAVNYSLQYKKASTALWTVISVGNADSYLLTELDASTSYVVKVAAVCSSNEVGIFSDPMHVTTVVCTEPANLAASEISDTSAKLTWSPICDALKFKVRYRQVGVTAWTTIKNITTTNYTITGLEPGLAYQVKVKSKCSGGDSGYSPSIFFNTSSLQSGKNVLLIIIDDARFDSYSANGGPSFFNDVNISRIANEGANFTQSFASLSLCAPSRGTIITGLYPHIHGITDNKPEEEEINDTIHHITLPQILQNHGYYTGLIGKYHISSHPQPGFNYWMENHNNKYLNTKFNINGVVKKVNGHLTDAVTDSALAFFHKVPDGKPFFLWLGYKAPHLPDIPRPEDNGLFNSFDMPFPTNYKKYQENVPEFLYDCHSYGDTAYITDYYRGYYELLYGVESRLGDIFDELSSMGIIDNTLIIFMSDNGYMLGEHQLIEKQLAYEESIHVPIFMRYPSLIAPGTVMNDQIALNIDIAPTILDFAGIPDTFGMQGISLLKLVDGSLNRTEMMYEFINKDCVPDMRGVRSLTHKYVQYHCSVPTEEFFDLLNDPLENINLINDNAYALLVDEYRDKLTFLRNYYDDFTWDSLYNCSLSNTQRLSHSEDEPLVLFNTFPNPASASIMVHFISSEKNTGSLQIVNTLGKVVYQQVQEDPYTDFSSVIMLDGLSPGNYFAVMQHGSHTYKQAFTRQ